MTTPSPPGQAQESPGGSGALLAAAGLRRQGLAKDASHSAGKLGVPGQKAEDVQS